MAVGPKFRKFLDDQYAKGIDPRVAPLMPGADAAINADIKDAKNAEMARSTGDWLKGNEGKGFASRDEQVAAIADPRYQDSPAYRAAVLEMTRHTPDHILQFQGPHDAVSKENLIKAARHDNYQAQRAALVARASSKDPAVASQARLDILLFHEDPANKALLDEYERTEQETKPLEYDLKQAANRGERVGTYSLSGEKGDADEATVAAIEANPMNSLSPGNTNPFCVPIDAVPGKGK
jgi:hypothetical protein